MTNPPTPALVALMSVVMMSHPSMALCQVIGERGGMAYSDLSGIALLLPYDHLQVGVCEMVSHPDWRTAVYPATLFTTAPLDILQLALRPSVPEGA